MKFRLDPVRAVRAASPVNDPVFALRPVSLAICLLGVAPAGFALPQGAVKTAGQTTVQVTTPGRMDITQSTPRASLDWTSFSIGAGERVNVAQPDRNAVLLNRVVGNDPSLIYGALTSNGNVWLINPRGIVFGANSQVNVGGLVASTLAISNDDIASGRLTLGGSNAEAAELRAEGQITATDGSVVLVAPQLMQSGRIQARRVGLAAASEVLVDVEGDSLIFFNVRNDRLQTRLSVLGNVTADGGLVDMRAAARSGFAETVLNLDGIVQARSIGMREGRIVVDGGASGITQVAGTLDATAASGKGGQVTVQGDKILLASTAHLDVSGSAGGGTLFVGGGFQGNNSAVRNASMVTVAAGAQLAANATDLGDAGTVIVWSDRATRFMGAADARGGARGGNGGLVEVSGRDHLDYRGTSDRSAPHGQAGLLLLDPDSLIIDATGEELPDPPPGFEDPLPGAGSTITNTSVQNLLLQGSVTLQSKTTIDVNASIVSGSNSLLDLQAGSFININAPITLGGGLRLSTNDPGSSTRTGAAGATISAALNLGGTLSITNNGGTGVQRFTSAVPGDPLSITAGALAISGDIELQTNTTWTLGSNVTLNNTLTTTGAFALTKEGAGVLTLGGASGNTGALIVNGGGVTLAGALGSTTITVRSGTLDTGATNRLADGAAVTVEAGGTLTLGGNDTIDTLALSGTLNGGSTRTLRAASTTVASTLAGSASVEAGLSVDALQASGTATIKAPVSVDNTATVTTGSTLTVGDGATAGSLSATTITADGILAFNRSDTVVLGAIGGAGTLRQAGSGELHLGGAGQVSTSTVAVNAGSLVLLTGNADRIADSTHLTLNGGELRVNNGGETIGDLTLAGARVTGDALGVGAFSSSGTSEVLNSITATSANVTGGTLTLGNGGSTGSLAGTGIGVASGAVLAIHRSGTVTLNNSVSGAGTLRHVGSGTLELDGNAAQISTATLEMGGGTLSLLTGNTDRIADSTAVTLTGGSLTLAVNESIGALTLAGAAVQGAGALSATSLTSSGSSVLTTDLSVSGASTVGGTSFNVGNGGATGRFTAGTSLTVDSGATLRFDSAAAGTVTLGTGVAGAGSLTLAQGSLALGGSSANLSAINVNGGTLTLANGSADRIGNSTAVTVATGGTLALGDQDETVGSLVVSGGTLAAGQRLTAGSTTLSGGAQINGNLGATGTVEVTGAATLNSDIDATAINVRAGHTLTLASNANIDPAALQVEAGATLTLNASKGATSLALAGTLAGGNGNTLTAGSFSSSGTSAQLDAALNVTNNATVQSGTLTVGTGSLAVGGTLTVDTGTTLDFSSAGAQTVGSIAGAGTLRHSGSNTLTLNGSAPNLTTVSLTGNGANLVLANGSGTRIGNGTVVSVGSNTTLTLGNQSETVGALTLDGTLAGTSTLTADNYTLRGGSNVNAPLGAGAASVDGTVTVNAATAANFTVNGGGALTLTSNSNLDADTTLSVLGGGTLTLGRSDTVSSLSLSGTLGGNFTLTTGTTGSTLNGGTVNLGTTLAGGNITVTGTGTSTLNGRSTAGRVTVNDGATLQLGNTADRLIDTSTLVMADNATLQLSVDELIFRLIGGGNIAGAGVLTIDTVELNNSSTTGNFTTSTLISTGSSRIRNAVTVLSNVRVEDGTLTVGRTDGSQGSLSVGGSITVFDGATLVYNRSSAQTLASSITGAGTFRQVGSGNLTLTGSVSTALIEIAGGAGSLIVSTGNNNRLGDSSVVSIASGRSLVLNNTSETIGQLALAGGTVSGTSTLTAATYTLSGGATANAALGTGQIIVNGSATLANTAGATSVIVNNGGTLGFSGTGSLDALADVEVKTGGTLTLNASDSVRSLTLAGTLGGSGLTLSASHVYTLEAGATVNANLGGGGTLIVAGNNTLAATLNGSSAAAAIHIDSGMLTLGSAGRFIASAPVVTMAANTTLTLAGAEVFSLAGAGTLSGSGSISGNAELRTGADIGASVALSGTTLTTTGAATLRSTANFTNVNVASGGNLTLASANRLNDGAIVRVDNGATLTLNGDDTVGTLTLAGTLAASGGTRTLTATGYDLQGGQTALTANLGAGTLTSSGGTLQGTSAASNVAVTSGTLLLDGAARLTAAPAMTLSSGATLTLGGSQTIGSLATAAGSPGDGGTLALGSHTLTVGNSTSTHFAGSITGSTGTLLKQGVSTLSFDSGSQFGAGFLTIDQGTVALGAADLVADTADITVAGGARLDLGGNDSVSRLTLSGTLGGSGTLTALADVRLTGGETLLGANLGIGTLISTGGTLRGTSAAGTVTVNSGSALVLGSADRLADDAQVTVNTGGALTLAGADTVDRLTLIGSLNGSGTLTADNYAINGGSTALGANLGAGMLTSTGGTLNGTAAADTVSISSGTLTLGSAARLTGTPLITITGGGLALGGNESIGAVTTAGTLGGTGTLSAAVTLQTNAIVDTNVAISGSLTVTGSSQLRGTASGPITVSGGTLQLGAANRLVDSADVEVGSGATLTLSGDDTIRSLIVSGTVGGSGRLNAGTLELRDGTYNLDLGGGSFVSRGQSTLNGSSAATSLTVLDGTLRLGSANRFLAAPLVNLATGSLELGGNETFSALTGSGGVALGTATLTLGTTGNDAYSGAITGAGNLTKIGSGTLTLGGANTYTGTTRIDAGTLRIDGTLASQQLQVQTGALVLGAADRLADTAAVGVAAGAQFTLGGNETIGSLALTGTLGGSTGSTLSAASTTLAGGSTVNAALGGGTLTSTGNVTLGFTAAATQVNVNGGTLTLASADRLTALPTTTVAAGARLALGGAQTLASLNGSGEVQLGSATLTTGGSGNSSYAGVISGTGSLVKQGSGVFTLSGANSYTGATTVQAGTLALNAADVLANGTAVTVASGATLTLGGNDSIASLVLAGTLGGSGTLSASTYTLNGGDTLLGANLGTGTLTSNGGTLRGTAGAVTVNIGTGNLVLGTADRLANNADVSVASGAALVLAGNDSIGSLALAGTLGGSGTLSATSYALDGATVDANLGGGALTSRGTSTLNGLAAVGSVQVDSGNLLLNGSQRLSNLPVVTVASGAALTLAGAHSLGSLAGSGDVALGAFTLSTGTAGDSSFGGVIGGSGGLVKTGNSVFTLGGANTYTGSTTVQAGTLRLNAADVLADASAVTIASGATLTLNGNDTVASLLLAGTLNGSGTLSAATYALDGGSALANLGAGALTSIGSSMLGGTSGASTVDITAGTLTLAAADRLADNATVNVASGATLLLNGNETIGTLAVSGTVGGVGVLSASNYLLTGGVYELELGSGNLTSTGNSLLKGSSGATAVLVSSGTLTLVGAHRLTAAPAVTVASGATLAIGGEETFGSLAGSGAVQVGTATLNTGSGGDSSYAGDLSGSGTLVKQGSSTFTLAGNSSFSGLVQIDGGTLAVGGTLAASTLQVNAGTLALQAAERLADTAAVNVASAATVTLAGDERIATLALAGTLSGSGTLSAARYALDGGSVNANLGAGTLSSTGNSTLTGSAAVTQLQVNGGSLTVAAQRFSALPSVTVAGGATLTLAGDQRFGTLAGSGDLALGSATLTTGAGGDSSFSGVIGGSGGLVKAGGSVFTLSGANSYSGATRVDAGTLVLAAADRLADTSAVSVASGATLQLAGNDTVASLVLAGQLGGTGRLTAATYSLDSGTVHAELGSGVLRSSGNSTLNGAAAVDSVFVNGGQLTLAAPQRLSALPVVGVAAGASVQLAGDQAFGTLGGAGTLNLASFTLNVGAGGDSSYGGVIAGSGGLVKVGSGTLTLGGANSYSGNTRIEAGTLRIDGTLASQQLQVQVGTLVLGVADRLVDTAQVTVASGAQFNLSGNDTIATLALAGTLGGSGTLTASRYALDGGSVNADLGAGALGSTGTSTLTGRSAATSVAVNGGTLTLAAADRLSALPATAVAGGATLVLAGAQTLGTLAGNGQVQLGSFTLSTGAGGDSRFDGTVSGSGGLTKAGSSVFTLGGGQTYTGVTTVQAGTLLLAQADVLADVSAVQVAGGATLTLNGNETVARLGVAGTLSGIGTLSAASYTLDGATVDAALGAGVLGSSGNSVLNANSAAGTVNVLGGTLLLASADRFSAAPAVTVADGATLRFGGDQRFGRLAGAGAVDLASFTLATGSGGDSSFGGVLAGSGGLVKQGASSFTLAGNNSYTGSTRIAAGTLRIDGTLQSPTIEVDAGTLALGSADRLVDTGTVNVASGARFTLAGNDSIATLRLAGTLDGSGTLSAVATTLNSGTVLADLGAGTLQSGGASTLAGRSAAATVSINDGTLSLGAADRLADNAAVSVSSGATLTLNGSDSVGTLLLQGALAGSGTLTATTYTFDGGVAQANLGAGSLISRGNSALLGNAVVTSVLLENGTFTLGSAQRFGALPAVTINAAATLVMTGDQAFGNLGGAGRFDLGSYALTTGSLGDSTFAGELFGSGGLIKQGASIFTLTGSNAYTGSTIVNTGTLRVGDGATSGSLASAGYVVDGTLAFARSDAITLSQAVSGSGSIEQAGSGRLLFSGGNKSYTGATLVSAGELATGGADNLPDASAVSVATGARLTLGGNETVRSVAADGAVALNGNLSATQDLLLRGAVTVAGNQAITLRGQRIGATNDGNRWGASLSLTASDRIAISSGRDGSALRDLVLGTVDAGNGGQIDAGRLNLAAVTTVSGGTLQLSASAPQSVSSFDPILEGRQITGLQIAFADDVLVQDTGSRISVAAGAGLSVLAPNGGSVQLQQAGNNFLGGLSVISGSATAAWTPNAVNASIGGKPATTYALQNRIRIDAGALEVGADGLIADIVAIRADRVATPGLTAAIVARMPFDATVGTATSLPALTFELTPASFTLPFPYGNVGDGGIRINVGSQAWGNRALPLDAGYIAVLPKGGAQGSTAVLLTGPAVGNYRFFSSGAGRQSEIPVFYNGILPTTPAVENSISATVSVSESARKERFEEAVRTENVAVRLRAGVIAEVGPAPSATVGVDGVRAPASCTPAQGLGCSAQ